MPARHLFADEHATHGRALCGLDVKPPDPKRMRTWHACVFCQNEARRLEREKAPRRRHHTDRIAED